MRCASDAQHGWVSRQQTPAEGGDPFYNLAEASSRTNAFFFKMAEDDDSYVGCLEFARKNQEMAIRCVEMYTGITKSGIHAMRDVHKFPHLAEAFELMLKENANKTSAGTTRPTGMNIFPFF